MERPVGYELKRAQQALRRAMDDSLRELDLTTPQYAALRALEEAPGASSAELARRSFVTAQTMNAIVAHLERAGLIERHAHPQHGRILSATLTGEGQALAARAHRRVRTIEARMVAPLAPAERHQLGDLLRRSTAALERTEAGEGRARRGQEPSRR